MFPTPDSDSVREGEVLAERVEALAAWIQELDTRLRTAELTAGDEKTAKELRKAVEALAKHDPKLEDRLTNRVDVLKDRLATLAETVAATSAGLAAKDGEIVALRRTLETERARLEGVLASAPRGQASADLDDLRKAVASLTAERPKSRGGRGDDLDGKIEVLRQRLDMLAETVSSTAAGLASRDGDIATLRRRLEEDGQKVEAALGELRHAVDPVPLAELKLTVKELAGQLSALERRSGKGLAGADSRIDAVSGELGSLAGTVSAATEELESSRREVTALRGAFDEESARLDSHVTRMEQALAALAPRLEALDGAAGRDLVEALDGRVQELSEMLESFSGRLDVLSRDVEQNGQGYTERELELAALSRRFEEERTGLEQLVSEVRSEVQALAEAGATAEHEQRLEDLAGRVEETGAKVLELGAAAAAMREQASGAQAELAEIIGQVAHRIEAVERERSVAFAELDDALASSAEERGALAAGTRLLEERVQALSEMLEALSRTTEETGRGYAERELELEALSDRFEDGRRHVESLVADLRNALETMPASDPARVDGIAEQVDALGRRVVELEATGAAAREQASGAHAELAEIVERIGRKIDAAEGERAASLAELQVALASSAEERVELAAVSRLLEERVQGLSAALDGVSERMLSISQSVEASSHGEAERAEELVDLSRRFDEARTDMERLASEVRSEVQTLVDASAGTGAELEARMTSLVHRVEALDGRLLEVAGARDDASGVQAELGRALAELRGAFDEETGRLDAHVARIEQTLASLGPQLQALDDIPQHGLVEALDERMQEAARSLEQVSRRIDAVERERAASLAELQGALAASAEERVELAAGSRLLEERVQGLSEVLEGVSGRLEEGRAEAASAAAELREALDVMPATDPVQATRLEVLAQAVEAQAATVAGLATDAREAAGLRGVLEVLAGRLDDLGARVETVAAAQEAAPSDRDDELAQRIEALAADVASRAASKDTNLLLGKVLLRLDALEREQQDAAAELARAAESVPSADEVAELGLVVEDARARLAASEASLAELGGQELAARLDELAHRLDLLEAAGREVAGHVEAKVVPIRGSEG